MKKISISKKVEWVTWLMFFVFTVLMLSVILFGFWQTRFYTIGNQHLMIGQMISNTINMQISYEINEIKVLVSSETWHNIIKEANLRFKDWKPETIQDYMRKADVEWVSAGIDAPIARERIDSFLGRRLKAVVKEDKYMVEMFLTDRYGGLVASSGKTTDFYQADEEWWQRAYNNGAGDMYFGDIGFDESSGKVSCALAVPVKDSDGQVIGVAKVLLGASLLFDPIEKYKFGQTGFVALLDESGQVVYHYLSKPMVKSEAVKNYVARLVSNRHSFSIYTEPFEGRKYFAAATRIENHLFDANRIRWVVVVAQGRDEIFAPFYGIVGLAILLAQVIALATIFLLRASLKRLFILPFSIIQKGALIFSHGDLDHHIEVKSGDELEQLGDLLNDMSANLKHTMVSRDHLLAEVNQRKEAEKKLLESEEKHRVLYEFSADAIMTLEMPDWRFTSGNKSALKMFGMKDEKEFISCTPWELSPEYQPDGQLSAEKARRMINLAIENGSIFFEWAHKKYRGDSFPATVLLTKICLGGKEIIQATVRDVTDIKKQERDLRKALKSAEESREIMVSMLDDNNDVRDELEASLKKLKDTQLQLIHAEKMEAIGTMASGVAHEVKNPLGIILQGINYFEEELPSAQNDSRETLRMMKDSVKRADKIVRALLDFSGNRELKTEQQNINVLLESSVDLVRHKLKLNSIEIVYELAGDLPAVTIDIERIEQVFVNLFNNAADAMPKGGKLYIRSYPSGTGAVVVEIEDTGPGIDASIINKIFDPFFTTKNRSEGTGLGLSVAKSIIDMHKGLIHVKSETGKGAKFTIMFKLSGGD